MGRAGTVQKCLGCGRRGMWHYFFPPTPEHTCRCRVVAVDHKTGLIKESVSIRTIAASPIYYSCEACFKKSYRQYYFAMDSGQLIFRECRHG